MAAVDRVGQGVGKAATCIVAACHSDESTSDLGSLGFERQSAHDAASASISAISDEKCSDRCRAPPVGWSAKASALNPRTPGKGRAANQHAVLCSMLRRYACACIADRPQVTRGCQDVLATDVLSGPALRCMSTRTIDFWHDAARQLPLACPPFAWPCTSLGHLGRQAAAGRQAGRQQRRVPCRQTAAAGCSVQPEGACREWARTTTRASPGRVSRTALERPSSSSSQRTAPHTPACGGHGTCFSRHRQPALPLGVTCCRPGAPGSSS